MTTDRMKQCRQALGLSLSEWAYALGYRNSTRDGLRSQAYNMEAGFKNIPVAVALLAEMYVTYGIPDTNRMPHIVSGE